MQFSQETPIRRNKYLIFDVETTGLIPKSSSNQLNVPNLNIYPYILQLSFVLYDMTAQTVITKYDSYISVDHKVVISDMITSLTGITHEQCQRVGRPIIEVLYEFYKAYIACDGIVAHNLEFDEKMILIEIERNREILIKTLPPCLTIFNPMYEKFRGIDRYCTMKSGTNLCNILIESSYGKSPSKKWPKLIELYKFLFNGEDVDGMHNSMIDVFACMRCYLKMRHNLTIEMMHISPY